MDRLIFGDNQFFGINHMSEDKALAQAMRFKDLGAIIHVVDEAYACGLRGFMFSSHGAVRDLCDHFRAHAERYAELRLYPVIPYARKYAGAVAEKGILGAIRDAVPGSILATAARGAWSLAKQDLLGIMRILVDAELAMFRDLHVQAVFLQNIVTDLLVGLGLKDVLRGFAAHVEDKHGAEAAFITMNLPLTVDTLLECGVRSPIVCASLNAIGYLMNPSRAACEEAIATRPFRPVAMSIFASGAVRPEEAIAYINRWVNLESVVFGASTKAHIAQSAEMLGLHGRVGQTAGPSVEPGPPATSARLCTGAVHGAPLH